MKKLIIFDLDGTLLDTLEDLSEAVNHALSLRGLPGHTADQYRGMVGHGVRNLVQQALEASSAANLTDEFIDCALADFKAYYQSHIDVHTRPYPGIPELLAALQERGVRLAVASNKFQEGTEYLIRRFFTGIDFVAILGNGPGASLKPSPEIVQEVLRRAAGGAAVKGEFSDMGISLSEVLMVGDSPTDIRTAANSGIEALAVTWGYRSADELAAVLRELFPTAADSLPDTTAIPDTMNRLVGSVQALRTALLGFYVSEPLTTPPSILETPLQKLIYQTFASAGIPFERVNTDPGITMEDCAHISARIGVDIVKTIFLCNRQQTEFYLYVTSHDKPFVTREFCSALGIPRVSFASAEKLWELTGVKVGATTILSAAWPACARVHLIMDASIAAAECFACTDGTPTCFVKLRTADLLDKYLAGAELSLI